MTQFVAAVGMPPEKAPVKNFAASRESPLAGPESWIPFLRLHSPPVGLTQGEHYSSRGRACAHLIEGGVIDLRSRWLAISCWYPINNPNNRAPAPTATRVLNKAGQFESQKAATHLVSGKSKPLPDGCGDLDIRLARRHAPHEP
jgi:hypothetical protein